MSWDTLSWQPVTPETLDGAGALVPLVPLMRSALDEAASALVMGPVSAAELSFATATSEELAGQLVPTTSIELLGTPRRGVWTAIEPAGAALNGVPVEQSALAAALAEALDAVFVEMLGEGLSLAPSTAVPETGAPLAVFRLALRDEAGTVVQVIVCVAENVPAELAMHVVALQALGANAATGGAVQPASPSSSPPSGAPSSATASMSVNDLAARAESTSAFGGANVAAGPVTPFAPTAAGAAGQAGVGFGSAPGTGGGGAAIPSAGGAQPGPAIRPFQLDELPPVAVSPTSQSIELLMGVNLQVTVEIGRTKLAIRDVLALTPGSIVELDKLAGEKVDVLVNGQQIAQGEVVVVDENFGVRITDVVSRQRRILSADTAA